MAHMTHQVHEEATGSHADHKMTYAGHDRHAGHSVAMFRDKFWLSFALTILVLVWSTDGQHWLGYTVPSFPGSKFIPAILGTVVFFLSQVTYLKMIQNLVWATGYNLVAIPVAGGLLVRWGVDLPMSVGAMAMSLSTIIVAWNAQTLRRLKLRHSTV